MALNRQFCRCCGRLIDDRDDLDFERTKLALETRLCVRCDMDDDELAEFEEAGESVSHLARLARELALLSARHAKGQVIGPCEVMRLGRQCSRKASVNVRGRNVCACHRKMAAAGLAEMVDDRPSVYCFVVADSLEDAMKQVEEAWRSQVSR